MPMVVVSLKMIDSILSREASSHITVRSQPGLPFFIITGE